jgi:hypothetical protein
MKVVKEEAKQEKQKDSKVKLRVLDLYSIRRQLDGLCNLKGNCEMIIKFKIAISKNINRLDEEIKLIDSIRFEENSIMKSYREKQNDLFKKYGKPGLKGELTIDKGNIDVFNAENDKLQEKFKDCLDKDSDFLKSELDKPFEFYTVKMENVPDDIDDRLSVLLKYKIVLED